MTRYKCQRGCVRASLGGKRVPMVHYARSECPYEPSYAGPKASGVAPQGAPQEAKEPPKERTSDPGELAPKPAKPAKRGILSFGSRPASVTSRSAPATTEAPQEWEVDEDHSLSAFELLDNIALRGIHLLDGALQVKPFQGHLLLNNSADEELVKKKFGRRVVTRMAQFVGAKSQEEAHGLIDSGGVLMLLTGMAFTLGAHLLEAWKESPVLQKAREKRKKKEAPEAAGHAPLPISAAQPVPYASSAPAQGLYVVGPVAGDMPS